MRVKGETIPKNRAGSYREGRSCLVRTNLAAAWQQLLPQERAIRLLRMDGNQHGHHVFTQASLPACFLDRFCRERKREIVLAIDTA
jgi:hypothetical protein